MEAEPKRMLRNKNCKHASVLLEYVYNQVGDSTGKDTKHSGEDQGVTT